MNGWIVEGFDETAWLRIVDTIKRGKFIDGNDYFGNFHKGALCVDIVLRDADKGEWLLCADGYLLGLDTGYGYTASGTPYEEGGGLALDFDIAKSYEETLKSFLEQIDEEAQTDKGWKEYASKTEPTWENEG